MNSATLLCLVTSIAGLVSMTSSLKAATRPAAVRTGLVATALTMGQLVFLATGAGYQMTVTGVGDGQQMAGSSS